MEAWGFNILHAIWFLKPSLVCSFDLGGGGGAGGAQLVFCQKKKTMWFIGVEVKQETSAPPPKKNPGSAPGSL